MATSTSGGPPIEWTLPLAERLHQALIGRAAGGSRIDCPELTGHTRDGQPLVGPHRHAYLLPVDLDQDGALDHVIVHATMGFGAVAQRTIESLRWLKCDFSLNRSSRRVNEIRVARSPVRKSEDHSPESEGERDQPPESTLPVRVIARWGWSAPEADVLKTFAGSIGWEGGGRSDWSDWSDWSDRDSTFQEQIADLRSEFSLESPGLIIRLYGMNWTGIKDHQGPDRQPGLATEFDSCQRVNPPEVNPPEVEIPPVCFRGKSIDGGLVWRSVTPLVLPRYLKRSGKNNLVGQVQAELASRGLPAAVEIEVIGQIDSRSSGSTRGYVLSRSLGGKRAPQACGYFLVIHFSDPVVGPVALGYASHFGLGLFSALETNFIAGYKSAGV